MHTAKYFVLVLLQTYTLTASASDVFNPKLFTGLMTSCEESKCRKGQKCTRLMDFTGKPKEAPKYCLFPTNNQMEMAWFVASALGNGWAPREHEHRQAIRLEWATGQESAARGYARQLALMELGKNDSSGSTTNGEVPNWKRISVLIPDEPTHAFFRAGVDLDTPERALLRDWGLTRKPKGTWLFEGELTVSAECGPDGFPDWTATLSSNGREIWAHNHKELRSIAANMHGDLSSSFNERPCSPSLWKTICDRLSAVDPIPLESLRKIPLDVEECKNLQVRDMNTQVATMKSRVESFIKNKAEQGWVRPTTEKTHGPAERGAFLEPILKTSGLWEHISVNGEQTGKFRERKRPATGHRTSSSGDVDVTMVIGQCLADPAVLHDIWSSRRMYGIGKDGPIQVSRLTVKPPQRNHSHRFSKNTISWGSASLKQCVQELVPALGRGTGEPKISASEISISLAHESLPSLQALYDAEGCWLASIDLFRVIERPREERTRSVGRPSVMGGVYTTDVPGFYNEDGSQSIDAMIESSKTIHRWGLSKSEASRFERVWKGMLRDLKHYDENYKLLENAKQTDCYQPVLNLFNQVESAARLGITNLKPITGNYSEELRGAISWFDSDNPRAMQDGPDAHTNSIQGSLICSDLLAEGRDGCRADEHKQWAGAWCRDVFDPAISEYGEEATDAAVEETCERLQSYTGVAAGGGGYFHNGQAVDITKEECQRYIPSWCK